MSDMDPTTMDAIAYGIAKLFHTPLDQLKAEAGEHRRAIVGSKAGAWANQALDYALNTESHFVAVAYLKPPRTSIYDQRSHWVVYMMPSREDLDNWYQGLVGMPDHYHYLAAYDKTSAEWARGSAVAAATGDADAHVGAAPSAADQLAHFDQLVTRHEAFWARSAQERPTPEMREFFQRHWDPWFTRWWTWRPYLGTEQGLASLRDQLAAHQRTAEGAPGVAVPADLLAAVVHGFAQGLSVLREYAAYNGIPTPDLGTSQHGFVPPGELPMVSGDSYPHDFVGADESYRDVAIHAVTSAQHQSPAPAYGYLRTGIHQQVYLFHTLDDAHGWYDQRAPGYSYAAVFDAANLHVPVVEDFGQPAVSGDGTEVGHWLLPLALGVPAGAYGGYRYREWQEAHPGKIIPWISGEVDGPWIDMVGVDSDVARRRAWPRTKALIQSAIHEARLDARGNPDAVAYVWSLESYGDTQIVPFSSREEALQYMRDRIQSDHVALALFDRWSPHWPNPVGWNKSDDPAHEAVIAQQIAKYAPAQAPHTAGWVDMVGAGPWHTIIGAAIDVFRRQAKVAAEEMPGRAIGVRRDGHNRWQLKSFSSLDDADDWFGHAIAEPADFTYAAYFSKDGSGIPYLENEQIGGARAQSARGSAIHRGIGEIAA
jgi:hypothetical protein